jgi:hypothetical protein
LCQRAPFSLLCERVPGDTSLSPLPTLIIKLTPRGGRHTDDFEHLSIIYPTEKIREEKRR